MVMGFLLMVALNSDTADPVGAAVARYRTIRSYEVTLRSSNATESQVIRYYYRKPGFVRMEFVSPHKGAVIIYNPEKREARVWPLGFPGFPSVTLDPANPLIRGPGGQRVDRSDVGALLNNVKTLQQGGTTKTAGEEQLSGLQALHVIVRGAPNAATGNVARYDLWLDTSTCFPVKVESRDAQGELIETVLMEDFRINVDFPERFFSP